MKKWGSRVLILLALALTAACALLPYAVSRVQDRYVESRIEMRSFEPVSLTLLKDGDLLHVLENMSRCVGMSWDGAVSLTETEAVTAARDLVSALTDAGLLQVYAQKYPLNRELLEGMDLERLAELCDLFPLLMVSTYNADFSAVVWVCYWHMGFEGQFIFDGSGGRLAAASLDLYENDSPFLSHGTLDSELCTKWAYQFQEFLSSYYEDGEISVGDFWQPNPDALECTLLFDPGNGQDRFELPMLFYPTGYFSFNLP